jgi:hypothetical protein
VTQSAMAIASGIPAIVRPFACGRCWEETILPTRKRPVGVISLAAVVGELHPHQMNGHQLTPLSSRVNLFTSIDGSA